MTTELPIEREANLRAQKKKILQLQRLKYSSATFDFTDDNAASASRDKHILFAQEQRPNLSDYNLTVKDEDTVACEQVGAERLTSNLATVDNNRDKVNKLERSESPGFTLRNKTPISLRRERQFNEETTEYYKERPREEGMKISIVVDNAEPEHYTASFASACSEYHRKTTKIKKKADERRRNVISPSIRHSSVLDLRSSNNDDRLTINDFQPRRSTSLHNLNCQYEDFDSKQTSTAHRNRREVSDRSLPQAFGERCSIPRASSWSSIYQPFPTGEKQKINFQGFARKQQEMLEDNLRRVEENLDTTFSRLRRYVNTETAINRTDSSGKT